MKTTRLSILASSLLFAAPALAQDDDAEPSAPVVTASSPVTISGFVDTSVYVPLTGFPDDGDEVIFGLDQVEIDVEVTPGEGVLIRTDLNVFPAAGSFAADDLFEQGFLEYENSGFFVQAGKRNAPIGAEAIDPTDLYQYSQGQLFSDATPSNLTGAFLGYRGSSFSAMVWATNDWDLPTTPRSASPGARFQLDFDPGHVGVSTTIGPLASDDPYIMVDADTALSFGDLTILGEVNFGTSDAVSRTGGLLTVSYAISSVVAATLRGDYLYTDQIDGDQVLQAGKATATAAGLFSITDNFMAVVEVRADMPEGADAAVASAFELLAYW